MKTVLITGGAGFIGSHTADLLIKNNYKVIVVDNLNKKTHNGKWPDYLNKDIIKYKGDVLDEILMTKLISKSDYIIHLAAEMDLNPDFANFMRVNVSGTALIYEIILKQKFVIKKVIIASTQFVYGEGKWFCKEHGDFINLNRFESNFKKSLWDIVCPICNKICTSKKNVESHSNPTNHYSLSKYFQEKIALELGKLYNIPSVALRYSIVHGPRQSLKNTYSGALRTFAINIIYNKSIATFEDNNSKRDFISVFDVAEANYFVLKNKKCNYQIFNVSGDETITIKTLANKLSTVLNKKAKFSSKIEYRIGDIRNAVSDSSKLKKLGWFPKMNYDETLNLYCNWFLKQKIDLNNFLSTQKNIRKIGIVKTIKK